MQETSSRADARHTARIVRSHARTFHFASRFLPPDKRRAAFAVYAFCREADDLVDAMAPTVNASVAQLLDDRRRRLWDTVDGRPPDALHRELGWAFGRFAMPAMPFDALLDALTADLTPLVYPDWMALSAYCAGVASTVGVICAHIFGMPIESERRASALTHAQTLGVAMQLTNILRDVGEDAARGRCYLPETDLRDFGIDRTEVLTRAIRASDVRWRNLMEFEVARARRLFAGAAPGLALVAADARACATLCSTGYAAILEVLEQSGYDSLTRRARVSRRRKARLAFDAWRGALGPTSLIPPPGAEARA
jgi:15-cis-phytoene synthase